MLQHESLARLRDPENAVRVVEFTTYFELNIALYAINVHVICQHKEINIAEDLPETPALLEIRQRCTEHLDQQI
jgi:hypothetical protein